MKSILRNKAISLRKKGFSIKEIASKMAVSQSTVSIWVRLTELNQQANARLQNRKEFGRMNAVNTNTKKREEVMREILKSATNCLGGVKMNGPLAKLSCALLYWCEGEKNSSTVRFMNSDPIMVMTFLDLMRRGFEIDEDKFRVCLHLHPYHVENKQMDFWSKVTSIPKKQFLKVFKKHNSGITIKKDYPGCASIRYHDYKVVNELKFIWKLFSNKYRRVV